MPQTFIPAFESLEYIVHISSSGRHGLVWTRTWGPVHVFASYLASFPGPRPASRRLQYGKWQEAGRGKLGDGSWARAWERGYLIPWPRFPGPHVLGMRLRHVFIVKQRLLSGTVHVNSFLPTYCVASCDLDRQRLWLVLVLTSLDSKLLRSNCKHWSTAICNDLAKSYV